jgi:hypothetical protein
MGTRTQLVPLSCITWCSSTTTATTNLCLWTNRVSLITLRGSSLASGSMRRRGVRKQEQQQQRQQPKPQPSRAIRRAHLRISGLSKSILGTIPTLFGVYNSNAHNGYNNNGYNNSAYKTITMDTMDTITMDTMDTITMDTITT